MNQLAQVFEDFGIKKAKYEVGQYYLTVGIGVIKITKIKKEGFIEVKSLVPDAFAIGCSNAVYLNGTLQGGKEEFKIIKQITRDENPEYFL